MKITSTKNATWLGTIALLLWVVEPLSVVELKGLPFFETLSIMFASGFILTAIRVTQKKQWNKILSQPIFVWMLGFTCICGSDFAYVLSAKCVPVAQIDLIDYLGPCLVVIFVSLLPKEKLRFYQIIGSILGVMGVFVLVLGSNDFSLSNINSGSILAYLLAIYGALIWSCYSALSRHYKSTPVEMIGMYYGIGAIICFIFHLKLETTVVPNFEQVGLASILGIASGGAAYQFWDFGIKFGNYRLLSSLSYFGRISAMALLVIFGKEPLTIALVVGVGLSCFGMFLSTAEYEWIKIKALYCKNKIKSLLLPVPLPEEV